MNVLPWRLNWSATYSKRPTNFVASILPEHSIQWAARVLIIYVAVGVGGTVAAYVALSLHPKFLPAPHARPVGNEPAHLMPDQAPSLKGVEFDVEKLMAGGYYIQSNPTMTVIIPDRGEFAAQGKIQGLDPVASTLTLVPESGPPIPMTVAPGVNLTNVSVGDVASVHYTRSVTFVVGSPNVAVGQVPATSTVGQVAQTPGGIGPGAAVIVGRVVKLDGPTGFDVVNANGGGIYTIKTTNPTQEAAIEMLKVGDSITVSVSPIIATSVAKCGLFGKGLFGC